VKFGAQKYTYSKYPKALSHLQSIICPTLAILIFLVKDCWSFAPLGKSITDKELLPKRFYSFYCRTT